MKKALFLSLLIILVFMVKIAFTQNIPQMSSVIMENPKGNDELTSTIVQTLGEDFILGRSFMRETNEVIDGQNCAVFSLGTNTPEKFTREEFIAVSPDNQIFIFDVVQNTWKAQPMSPTVESEPSYDYALYRSVIADEEGRWGKLSFKEIDAFTGLYDVWGVSFIKLADFNDDGIFELILVRMSQQISEDGTSTNPDSDTLQIFTLEQTGQGQRVKNVGVFPLMQVGLSPAVELNVADNKTYLITGDQSDPSDWSQTFWQLTPTGFVRVKEFAIVPAFDRDGYLGNTFHIDGKRVDPMTFHADYQHWTDGLVSTQITNCLFESIEKLQANNMAVKEKLSKLADNNAHGQGEKTFAAKFMGYTSDWLGMPDISPYFTEAELFSLNHQNFGGFEMYLVKNNRQGRTYVYENIIDEHGQEQVGRRLYEAKAGEVLFFTCNPSDISSNIVLLYVSPDREEFYFRPSLSLMDGSINFGDNAEALQVK